MLAAAMLVDDSLATYAERTAYKFLGRDIRCAELDQHSRSFAAYCQHPGLRRADWLSVIFGGAILGIMRLKGLAIRTESR